MNYAFKMIAVVLALGVLVLQGCQTGLEARYASYDKYNSSLKNTNNKSYDEFKTWSNIEICQLAINKNTNEFDTDEKYIKYVNEAKKRQLNCLIIVANIFKKSNINSMPKFQTWNDYEICGMAINKSTKIFDTKEEYLPYVTEAKQRGLDCGVKKSNEAIIASKTKTQIYTKPKPNISSDKSTFKSLIDKHNKGLTLANSKKYRQAIEIFKDLSLKGYNPSQNNLGIMYADGLGVKKSIEEAVKFWKLAAQDNHKDSLYNLGHLYYVGDEEINKDFQ